MAEPNIVAFRIDERLIHGQGQLWIKALGANTVIVADDGASEDPMQQMLMKAVVPKTIAMRFFSVQHTCDVIMKASPKQTIFIVCKTPEDALRLVKGGVPVSAPLLLFLFLQVLPLRQQPLRLLLRGNCSVP